MKQGKRGQSYILSMSSSARLRSNELPAFAMRGCLLRQASAGQDGGHVSAAPDRPAIILDGNVTDDQLCWLSYDRERHDLRQSPHMEQSGTPFRANTHTLIPNAIRQGAG